MRNFFNKVNERIQTFMVGRNGADRLSRWSLGAAIVMLIINLFVPNIVCSMLSYIFLFYCIYRIFSGNVAAREAEEEKFDDFLARFKSGGKKKRRDTGFTTRKASTKSASAGSGKAFFTCEECGQSLSVPKGRGKLRVTCPKCHHQQIIKS